MTREAFYVAMTRGRRANTTYVITDDADPELEEHAHAIGDPPSTQQVLRKVLTTEATERSATEQIQQQFLHSRLIRPLGRSQHAPRHSRLADSAGVDGFAIER